MKWRHGSDNNPLGHGRGRGVVVGVNCVMWEWWDVCVGGVICFRYLAAFILFVSSTHLLIALLLPIPCFYRYHTVLDAISFRLCPNSRSSLDRCLA